jgi:hypothetical protein
MRIVLLPLLLTLTLAATSQAQVPRGRLTDNVTPTAYKIEITVLPEKPGFHAHVEIALQAKAGAAVLYLHGRKLQVKKAQFAQAEGAPVSVKYREVDDSGVARIDLPHPLQAGPAKLLFDYDA